MQKNSFTLLETIISITILLVILAIFNKISHDNLFENNNYTLLNNLENDFDTKNYLGFHKSSQTINITKNDNLVENINVNMYFYKDENLRIFKYENSFSIFELILSLIISSFVIVFSSKYIKEIYLENQNIQNIEKAKIDLSSTKIFIQKNINNLNKISFSNGNLYFENEILLDKVKDFKINKNSKEIEIFINFDNKIAQIWKISI